MILAFLYALDNVHYQIEVFSIGTTNYYLSLTPGNLFVAHVGRCERQ